MTHEDFQQAPEDVKKILGESKIPDDLKEVVARLARDAEDVDLRLQEFKFIQSMKMFGVAVGGAIIIIGILFALVALFMFFNLFSLVDPITYNIRLATGAISVVLAFVQILAGVLLIAK